MHKFLVFLTLILFSSTLTGQISMKDSTVQVIGYWNKLETQSYNISYQKLKIKSNDTISRELVTYQVDVKIIDSTENSYTIEWFYKNYNINTENKLAKKLSKMSNDISVKIKTDQFGTFIEVVNWEDIKTYLTQVSDTLKVELKDIPNSEKIIDNVMSLYATKESIEANAIKDALQYYQFNGVKYKLGEELQGTIETANNFGGAPFQTNVSYSLDKINETEGNAVFRSNQIINSQQLTDETYKYLKNSGAFSETLPTRSEFPNLTNETNTASIIHAASGWVIYSIESKKIAAADTTNIEERIIEIQ
ncbi:hypothetical protein [Formosa sp. L2A11]|uniref:hypothetical protein n=1 Tax=Formosa sp. L2A11 TaxID=2686363 RepID=UPI00131C1E15|nr:hypothetical protein [Formosa sp. L2A11]